MRAKKNIKLCHRSFQKGRFYDQHQFTPDDVYKNEKIPWLKTKIFRGGKFRKISYKEVNDCLWQSSTKRKFFKLIVLKKTPYKVRKGKLDYRKPAYLLAEKSEVPTKHLIQAYHDHIGIELNIKDEKQLGVTEAQVRNEKSVFKQPAFSVATYSALLLAAIATYQEKVTPHFGVLPIWRKNVKRPSTRMLIRQLKKEVLAEPNLIHELHLSSEQIEMLLRVSA